MWKAWCRIGLEEKDIFSNNILLIFAAIKIWAAIHANKRGTDKWHDPMKKKVKINKYTQVLSGSV